MMKIYEKMSNRADYSFFLYGNHECAVYGNPVQASTQGTQYPCQDVLF